MVTGSARGHRLATLEGEEVRPTASRVKEAIFSSLQLEIPGSRVLDLFAGSGQLGIEALSRGAASCVFCDARPEAVQIVRQNLAHTKLAAAARVAQCDFSEILRSAGEYDIAFVDPPYSRGIIDAVLPALAGHMSPGGVIVCESDERDALPAQAGGFVQTAQRRYGRTRITYYRKAAAPSA